MAENLVTHVDLLPVSAANAVSGPGQVRLTRTFEGLQISVDGSAPGPISGGSSDEWFDETCAALLVQAPFLDDPTARYEYIQPVLRPGGAALGTGAVSASVEGGAIGVANDTTYLHLTAGIVPLPRTSPWAIAVKCKFPEIVASKTTVIGLANGNTAICTFGTDHTTSATKWCMFVSGGASVISDVSADTNWHLALFTSNGDDEILLTMDGVEIASSAELATLTNSLASLAMFSSASQTPGCLIARGVYAFIDPA